MAEEHGDLRGRRRRGAYVCYFGLFPRLLRKADPSRPLDAWRQTTYLAWIIACVAAMAFKGPLQSAVLGPLLGKFVNDVVRDDYFMEAFLLPVVALVGLLVIWNFRRDSAGPRTA